MFLTNKLSTIVIMISRSGQGVVVSMILRGGAAHAEGTLMAGDHILSINGKDVQNATREEVASLLKVSIHRSCQVHVGVMLGQSMSK